MVTTKLLLILLLVAATSSSSSSNSNEYRLPRSDVDLLEFPLNLEYLEAEFFLFGSLGKGLDQIQPNLTGGGPPPIGARMAKLSPLIRDIILQFGLEEVGHIRAIKSTVPGFPRPLMNLSVETFANVINSAFGKPLYPVFDPYANDINFLIASYVIPYVGLTGYVGANPLLINPKSKKLVAGLLGIEAGQDAVIRTLLYERKGLKVFPYGITVATFTDKISILRNKLGHAGIKDEGLTVPRYLGAEGMTTGNILSGNASSLSYPRTPEEILGIVYQTGSKFRPGGFYPCGANGTIARKYLTDYETKKCYKLRAPIN
ncbi:desiccation-related protein PCC13-62-like [Rutidosis leptorrhynchoides]|uniref:desiccation-related protein PCC13-62-like n=1 Tax=Rutidosis leptorrhynchoides TaxID=125765 RepID=UPI003A98F92E